MQIPIYHKAISHSAFAAGLDAVVYGMLKQGLKSPGFDSGVFMGSQTAHIARSVLGHRKPFDFISDLCPEISERLLTRYLEEGYSIASSMPVIDKGGAAALWDCAIVYALAKAVAPEEIIETGTGIGATSCMALRGTFHYVQLTTFDREEDVVDDDGITYARWDDRPRSGVGYLIPKNEERRVSFELGDIRQTLPAWIEKERLSPRTPTKALVILDSMHTPEHQIFEADSIWPILKEGSVILCDDTTYGWSKWANSFLNCGFLGGIRK